MKLTKDDIRDIKSLMFGLSGRQARAMAERLAVEYGVDVSRIYYYSRDVRPKRDERSDKGKFKTVDEDSLRKLLVYTVQHDFSATHLAEVAEANGVRIHPATYNRILRQINLSRRMNKVNTRPWTSWEAKYPNQLHQIDSTVAQQFYLDDDGSIGYELPMLRNKNKPGNRKPRLHLISVIDDYSRSLYARFTLGNHTSAWMDTLYRAWSKKDTPAFPFYGIPKILYSDNDSVIKSRRFKTAMEKLDVILISHAVGNSQAKGKVENSFKLLQEFEKVTKIKRFKSLEEANEALFDFLIGRNSRIHSTTKKAPFARWLEIDPEKLRNTPSEEIFNLLHLDFTTRLVHGDLHIEMFGKKFYLPRKVPFINYVARKVEVCWYPRDEERIFVILEGKEYEIQYQEAPMLGVGQAPLALNTELPEHLKLKEEIEQAETPDWKLTGFYEEKYGKLWMEKEGKEFDESKITGKVAVGERMRSKLWFMNQLQKEFLIETPPSPEEKAWIDSIFEGLEEMEESKLNQIIKQVRDGDIEIASRAAM